MASEMCFNCECASVEPVSPCGRCTCETCFEVLQTLHGACPTCGVPLPHRLPSLSSAQLQSDGEAASTPPFEGRAAGDSMWSRSDHHRYCYFHMDTAATDFSVRHGIYLCQVCTRLDGTAIPLSAVTTAAIRELLSSAATAPAAQYTHPMSAPSGCASDIEGSGSDLIQRSGERTTAHGTSREPYTGPPESTNVTQMERLYSTEHLRSACELGYQAIVETHRLLLNNRLLKPWTPTSQRYNRIVDEKIIEIVDEASCRVLDYEIVGDIVDLGRKTIRTEIKLLACSMSKPLASREGWFFDKLLPILRLEVIKSKIENEILRISVPEELPEFTLLERLNNHYSSYAAEQPTTLAVTSENFKPYRLVHRNQECWAYGHQDISRMQVSVKGARYDLGVTMSMQGQLCLVYWFGYAINNYRAGHGGASDLVYYTGEHSVVLEGETIDYGRLLKSIDKVAESDMPRFRMVRTKYPKIVEVSEYLGYNRHFYRLHTLSYHTLRTEFAPTFAGAPVHSISPRAAECAVVTVGPDWHHAAECMGGTLYDKIGIMVPERSRQEDGYVCVMWLHNYMDTIEQLVECKTLLKQLEECLLHNSVPPNVDKLWERESADREVECRFYDAGRQNLFEIAFYDFFVTEENFAQFGLVGVSSMWEGQGNRLLGLLFCASNKWAIVYWDDGSFNRHRIGYEHVYELVYCNYARY